MVGDNADNGGVEEHPGLHGGGAQFGEDGLDLRADDGGLRGLDGGDPLGVLRRQASDGAGAVDTEGGEGLEVGLDARAPAAVGTGNR